MAEATSRPLVVANVEVNDWSLLHLDLLLHNAGAGPAFNVELRFDPALPTRVEGREMPPPFQSVSLLRPGQVLKSYIADYAYIKGQRFRITISWRRKPSGKKQESISYILDMTSLEGVSILGSGSPEVQIAREIKNIRNDWKAVSQGTRRLKADVFSSHDRKLEREDIERRWAQSSERPKEPE
jgi:hypothetical protein